MFKLRPIRRRKILNEVQNVKQCFVKKILKDFKRFFNKSLLIHLILKIPDLLNQISYDAATMFYNLRLRIQISKSNIVELKHL